MRLVGKKKLGQAWQAEKHREIKLISLCPATQAGRLGY